jgi:cysteine desulfurase/selenocysteine lyase
VSAVADITSLEAQARRWRDDFPLLEQKVHGHDLAYLDSAATTQKPESVISVLGKYYREENANIHRGVYALSQKATHAYEQSRKKVADFIGAKSFKEVVFVRGTTEAINLVAQSFGRVFLKEGDEILVSAMEHHSNIVPWQLVTEQTGAVLRVIPMTENGDLDQDAYAKLLSAKTKLVALCHVSNAIGTVNPIKDMIAQAHAFDVPVLIDGAQGVPHTKIDVQDLDCDFYAFSGHKMYGPTGVGVLYAKEEYLERMSPYQGGGDMILSVTFEKTTYNEIPYKFEAGTPNISGVIGLGAAIDYVSQIGMDRIASYEASLMGLAVEKLRDVDGLRFIGEPKQRAGALSFILEGIHPHDLGTILDMEGVAIRTGHHCAQPVMTFFAIPASARASFGLYNNEADIDALVSGLAKAKEVFKR